MKKLAFFLGLAIAVFVSAQIAQATQVIDDALQVNSLKVGQQGVGGVTYFNGTIINETTGENDVNNPVTFGDNVRIDGRVYRGATAGTDDEQPFLVNDNMEVSGGLTAGSFVTEGSFSVADLYISDEIILTGNLRQGINGEGAVKAWAFIESNGTSISTAGWYYTFSEKVATGKYEVTFGIDISTVDSQSGIRYPSRPMVAVPNGVDGNVTMRMISIAPHATDPNIVQVWTTDADGDFADSAFSLVVY